LYAGLPRRRLRTRGQRVNAQSATALADATLSESTPWLGPRGPQASNIAQHPSPSEGSLRARCTTGAFC